MIHYHGTPMGGSDMDAMRFLRGKHALVSFAYPRQLALVAEGCQSFVLDSGAFTVWRQGGTLDIPDYLKWVEEWHRHPGFDWALIPDKIDGDEADNDRLLRGWPADWRHFGVPVWHLHESLARLKRLACPRFGFRRVALGSSGQWPTPGMPDWWLRMKEAMAAVCDAEGRPTAKLHGLRMLNPDVFRHLPLASADSCNVARNNQPGNFCNAPSAWIRSVAKADEIEFFGSAARWRDVPDAIQERIAAPLYDATGDLTP